MIKWKFIHTFDVATGVVLVAALSVEGILVSVNSTCIHGNIIAGVCNSNSLSNVSVILHFHYKENKVVKKWCLNGDLAYLGARSISVLDINIPNGIVVAVQVQGRARIQITGCSRSFAGSNCDLIIGLNTGTIITTISTWNCCFPKLTSQNFTLEIHEYLLHCVAIDTQRSFILDCDALRISAREDEDALCGCCRAQSCNGES